MRAPRPIFPALLAAALLFAFTAPAEAGGVNMGTLRPLVIAILDSLGVTENGGTPVSGSGDITAVVAGDGLTDGGTTGSVTLNVAVGTGLAVAADEITLDDELVDVAGVTPTADQFLGGTGTALAMRTATQVRASLVLATTDSPTFAGLTLSAATSGSGTATTVGFLATTEDVTAGSGAPNVLTAAESGKVITNEGATALAYNTLPAAAAGLCFTFVVSDADGIRITAAGDDTIRVLSLVSPAAGYTESTTIGSTIHVVAISATKWIAVSAVGTWTVSS